MRNTPACFINSTMSLSNRCCAAKSRRRALTSDRSRWSASLRPSIVVCSAIGISSGRQTAFRRDVTINIKPIGKLFSAARVAFSQRYFLQRESSLAGLASAKPIRFYAARMHPYIHAKAHPDKPAYIMAGSGETVTYRQLDEQSNRIAQLFRSLGLKAGDHVALFLENNARFFEICWGAQRSGLIYTAISSRLTAAEVDYIVGDCGAKLFITSRYLADKAAELAPLLKGAAHRYMIDGTIAGYESWEETVARFPATPIADETAGHDMLYSSGTTGRPKGVLPVQEPQPIDYDNPLLAITRKLYGMDADTVYLSPAPLYHAAPLRFNMSVMRLGGTSVIMEHFDAEEFLKLVGRYRITHTQLVPTMFVRLLKLPDEVRAEVRRVVAAGAPSTPPRPAPSRSRRR